MGLIGAWSCSSGRATEMTIVGVSPERLPLGAETVLTVTGTNLRASMRIDLDDTKPAEQGHLVAWVGKLGPLTGTMVSSERLQIVVPGELALGLHELVVRDTLAERAAHSPNAIEVFVDAQSHPAADAGTPTATIGDAAAVDAAVSGDADAGGAATPAPCSGIAHGGVCWYLGAAGATCEQTCGNHGGYAPAATAFVGTAAQGGSAAACAELLGLLGRSQSVIEASRADVGLGCHLWGVEERAYWLTAPHFASTAGSSAARVVCGCSS